jgi:hypothetical protein
MIVSNPNKLNHVTTVIYPNQLRGKLSGIQRTFVSAVVCE